jgi:hypothetical protein
MSTTTKNLVITGGSKGIGRAIVELFSLNGFTVFTCGRNLKKLEEMQEIFLKTGHKIFTYQADLSSKEGCESFVNWIKQNLEAIDILIHNSGIFLPDNILMEEDDVFEQSIRLNVKAPYILNKRLYPLVKKVKGHIIHIASVASQKPFPGCGSYVASKYALLGYSKVLREITKEEGVKVTAIMPGATYTSSWEGSGIAADRIMSPQAVAKVVWDITQLSGNALVEEITLRPLLGDL